MNINLKQVSLTRVYTCWATLLVLLMIIWTLTGRYQEMMSQSVSKVSPQLLANTTPEAMTTGFIVISIIYALMMIGIGYFLVVFADKGKKWAQWIFLFFCLWSITPSFSDLHKIFQTYPNLLYPAELFKWYDVTIGLLLLCTMIVLIWKVLLLIRKQEKSG